MFSDEFEQAFGEFVERREYDEAQCAIFELARTAFMAGWEAAGGFTTASAASPSAAGPATEQS